MYILEKIDYEQMNKLLNTLEKARVSHNTILSICNVKYLQDITVVQYNNILLLFSHFEAVLNNKEDIC